jgi:heme A synthase
MLNIQVALLTAWRMISDAAHDQIRDQRDRGEVTATTAMIVLLVVAAIAAGTIIAARITANANNVPSP